MNEPTTEAQRKAIRAFRCICKAIVAADNASDDQALPEGARCTFAQAARALSAQRVELASELRSAGIDPYSGAD